jgi:hypothetical protein
LDQAQYGHDSERTRKPPFDLILVRIKCLKTGIIQAERQQWEMRIIEDDWGEAVRIVTGLGQISDD